MYLIEKIEESFIIRRNNVPIFGGSSKDYYIQKDDVFTISIISFVNSKDRFSLRIDDLEVETVANLFSDAARYIFKADVADALDALAGTDEYQIGSAAGYFYIARFNIPLFCAEVNTILLRTDSQRVFLHNKSNLELIQALTLEEAGETEISDLYTSLIEFSTGTIDKIGLTYKGAWDANANIPDIGASDPINGDYYKVSVSGSTNLSGITDWVSGDWAIFNGLNWEKIDQTERVISVNGYIGAVVLDPDDLDDTLTVNKFTTQAEIDKLAGIEPFAEVNNISDADALDLTDGGETNIHTHHLSNLNGTLDDIADGIIYGKVPKTYDIKFAAYSLDSEDRTIEVSVAGSTQSLPTAVGISGTEYRIINTSAGKVRVETILAQTLGNRSLETRTFIILNKEEWLDVISDGSNWRIV